MDGWMPSLIAGWGRGRDNYLGYPTVNCQNAPVSCYPRAPLLGTTDPRYPGGIVYLYRYVEELWSQDRALCCIEDSPMSTSSDTEPELNPLQVLEELTQQRWVWVSVAILWVSVFGFILLHKTFTADESATVATKSEQAAGKRQSNKKKGKRKAQ